MAEDTEAIRRVVTDCVTGFNRGDQAQLMCALHPRCVSAGFVRDALQWDSAEDFAAFCAGAAPDPDGPIPDWEIEPLTVFGRTAVAVVLDQ